MEARESCQRHPATASMGPAPMPPAAGDESEGAFKEALKKIAPKPKKDDR